MHETANTLARQLARRADAVCRAYLSNGRREGRYWIVGDVRNAPGRSMFVRLSGPEFGKGAAGKWTDAATGEHGDLLDVIREAKGLVGFREVADEARRFIGLPCFDLAPTMPKRKTAPGPKNTRRAARGLFAMSLPIGGTLADTYLRNRGIAGMHRSTSLRFHPRCNYRRDDGRSTESWPAMVAAVTDLKGNLTGIQRTWLDPDGFTIATLGKAPLEPPRRALGDLAGNAVRFGTATEVMAVGEGIETMLSLRTAMPNLPMAAALSATHLAAIELPETLQRLYILRDNDIAGNHARDRLAERAALAEIQTITLTPARGDLNEDLRVHGLEALRMSLRTQMAASDVARFMG